MELILLFFKRILFSFFCQEVVCEITGFRIGSKPEGLRRLFSGKRFPDQLMRVRFSDLTEEPEGGRERRRIPLTSVTGVTTVPERIHSGRLDRRIKKSPVHHLSRGSSKFHCAGEFSGSGKKITSPSSAGEPCSPGQPSRRTLQACRP